MMAAAALVFGLAQRPVEAQDSTNDLDVLKRQVRELNQKVEQLESQQQQRAAETEAATKQEKAQAEADSAKQQQIENLDQQVRILQRQRELDQEAAAEAVKSRPKITAGAGGFAFGTANGDFSVGLHGVLQVDSRTFFNDNAPLGADGFLLRRARPILSGTVFKDIDFMFVPDFGGSTVQIFDAYLNYRYSPEVQLQAGKFKGLVGLESLQSDVNIFFNERALATDLVPNRDIGLMLHGDCARGVVSYAAGVFNSTTDYNGSTTNANFDNNVAYMGRMMFLPFKPTAVTPLQRLGFGVGGSYEIDQAWTNTASTALTPGFTTDGQQRFFSYTNGVVGRGTHWRVAPQAYYCYGPLEVFGEYVISDQQVVNVPKNQKADLQNTAWEVSAGWILTGEEANYNVGVVPKHPFNPVSGNWGWGAWQIVGRYAQLNVDPDTFPTFANPATSASTAHAWAVGLNWYLNRNVRCDLSYSHTSFTGGQGPGATVTRDPEQVLFTRIQLGF